MKVPTSERALWESNEYLELAEASGIGVWDLNLVTGELRGRPQFFRVMGLEPTTEPISIEVTRALRHPDDRDLVIGGYQQALAQGKDTYEREYRIIRPDGQLRWILGRGRIVRDSYGRPVRYSGVDIDVTDRKQVEAALVASEQRYRDLVERANDIVATFDLQGRVTSINSAVERVLGYKPNELVGQPLRDMVPPDEMPMHDAMLARKLAGEPSTRYEMHIRSRDGRTITLEVNSQLLRNSDGAATGIHSIARDITDRKAAELRRELLVQEHEHRVKNLLAVIQSVTRSTLATSKDLATARSTIDGRLQALARAQQFIKSGDGARTSIVELVEGELSAFSSRVRHCGPPVSVPSRFAQMFAVVVHELATNATKYGALATPDGIVDIRWSLGDGRFSFAWKEHGGPPVTAPQSRGFGTKLLVAALGGAPRLDYSAAGFSYTVDVPMDTWGDDRAESDFSSS